MEANTEMPTCHYCGSTMRQTAHGHSGTTGGGGNKYRCPNMPHPKCPICNRTMSKPTDPNDRTFQRRLPYWNCPIHGRQDLKV